MCSMRTYAPQAKPSARIPLSSTSPASRVAVPALKLQRILGNQVARRLLSAVKRREVQRAYVISAPVTRERRDVPEPTLESTAIQRQPHDAGSQTPALAAPSLTLTGGGSLTRGDTLTAKVDFTPTAGEKLNVTGWRFTSLAGDVVTRAAKD